MIMYVQEVFPIGDKRIPDKMLYFGAQDLIYVYDITLSVIWGETKNNYNKLSGKTQKYILMCKHAFF